MIVKFLNLMRNKYVIFNKAVISTKNYSLGNSGYSKLSSDSTLKLDSSSTKDVQWMQPTSTMQISSSMLQTLEIPGAS